MKKEYQFDYVSKMVEKHLGIKRPNKWKNLKLGGKLVPTGGNGLWSDEERKVKVLEASIRGFQVKCKNHEEFAELRVRFNTKSWNTNKYGLIYTDRLWLREFRNLLLKKGFSSKAVKDVDYSEQGMQGDNYVSMDVGKHFLKEWKERKLTITEV
jgi:hypothetical protein